MSSAPADRRRSAAWRLAVPALVVFALGSGAVLLLAYRLTAAAVHDRFNEVLASEAADLAAEAAGVPADGRAAWLDAERDELHRYLLRRRAGREERTEVVVAVADGQGRALAWSGVADAGPLLAALSAAGTAGERTTVTVPGTDGPLRAVRWRNGDVAVVVAASESGDTAPLPRLLATLVAAWAAMVAIGTAVAVWSVRDALGRVESLGRAAAAISDPESGQRLSDRGEGDEIARLAATLNGMLDRIAAGVREVRELSQSVAHDLRSPLTVARGRLELALTREGGGGDGADGDGDWRGEVAAVIEELDRLNAVVETALDVAEAEGGALQCRRQAVDLAALCAGLAELYEPAAQERGMRLECELPPVLPADADPQLLRRALGNLLDNALRHAAGAHRILLSARREDGGGVALRVEDDGPGFAPAVLARPFERASPRPGGSGFGLGLPLVRAVARAHGGEATLGAGDLSGAAVTIHLPPSA